jgi:hypothetical protein
MSQLQYNSSSEADMAFYGPARYHARRKRAAPAAAIAECGFKRVVITTRI